MSGRLQRTRAPAVCGPTGGHLWEGQLTMAVTACERSTVPRHLGIVLDGNRRWARSHGLACAGDGHRTGFGKIPEVLGWCEQFGIEVVTLWMLSDDNIRNRSAAELADLYDIDADVISKLITTGRWRLRHIGEVDLLPRSLAAHLRDAEAVTAHHSGLTVNLALAYGGRSDVVNAVRRLLLDVTAGAVSAVTEEILAGYLSTAGQPDPDLIIRPAGEIRTSGFLLWQAALSELYFCNVFWPDFAREDLQAALRTYSVRSRRFGA